MLQQQVHIINTILMVFDAVGVVMGKTSIMLTPVNIDIRHPFIFVIYDKDTDAVLFLGRVLDPSE